MRTLPILFVTLLLIGLTTACRNASDTKPTATVAVWTCSMHPQIRQDHPGKCPLCAMDLIPLKPVEAAEPMALGDDVLTLSAEAAALADIQTTTVSRTQAVKTLTLFGTIQLDERRIHTLTSQVNGRIEKLYVNFAGETIRKGQTVATLYSSDLLNAQQELLEAIKLQQPALLAAAREKLRLWKLTDRQISAIEATGKASPLTDLIADATGIVLTKKVEQGESINSGTVLFDLADLSTLWAVFQAYESDLPYLSPGDKVSYTTPALPGQTFTGTIAFIDPVLDKTTRTARVRVETANPRQLLKPEMYATAHIQATLAAPTAPIVIPRTAILWTGPRSIVYVKLPTETPSFQMREIELGPSLGDAYVVLSGLSEGEQIITRGAFAVDAAAQLEGKPSMMNPRPTLTDQTLVVHGACGMCQTRIETTALTLAGVAQASWNPDTQTLHLQINTAQTKLTAVSQALAAAGHDTEMHKADQATYDNLPGCCHYRE